MPAGGRRASKFGTWECTGIEALHATPLVQLSELLSKVPEDEVSGFLGTFSCARNLDVQKFLRSRAIGYEKCNKARTYLFINDQEELQGYFSIALTCVSLESLGKLKKTVRKRLNGLFDPNEPVACYLIGQLGRNDTTGKEDLPGPYMLEKAMGIIKATQYKIAGRFVLVECEDKLLDFYKNNDFKYLHSENGLCQMYRMLG